MFWRGYRALTTGGFPIVYKADRRLIEFLGWQTFSHVTSPGGMVCVACDNFFTLSQRTRYGMGFGQAAALISKRRRGVHESD